MRMQRQGSLRFCIKASQQRLRRAALCDAWRLRLLHLYGLAVLIVALSAWVGMVRPMLAAGSWPILITAVVGLALAIWAPWHFAGLYAASSATELAACEYRLSAKGLVIRVGGSITRIPWSCFERVEASNRRVILHGKLPRHTVTFEEDVLEGASIANVEAICQAYLGREDAAASNDASCLHGSARSSSRAKPTTYVCDEPPDAPRPVPPTSPSRPTHVASDSLATAALICGICAVVIAFVCFPFTLPIGSTLGLVAIGLSLSAIRRVRRDPQRHTGTRAAIIGLILGIVAAAAGIVVLAACSIRT